jgi:hypothetical protein
VSHGGTEALIRNIDAMVDNASSDMRDIDAYFAAAVGESGDKKERGYDLEKCSSASGNRSSKAAAGRTTRSRAKQLRNKRP